MGHPVIDELSRVRGVGSLQNHVFNRIQRVLRDEVQPMLDERETLLAENADLKAQLEYLQSRVDGAPVEKRGPGRPRKVHEVPA